MGGGIFEAYSAGEAGGFFPGHFARIEDRNRARSVVRPIAPALADALETQNGRYEKNAKRAEHLRALRSGAAAVVTGQQVGLFLGPLFTLYKCATTIRLAQALAAEWGVAVVPVFWLQTEDHDLAEIAGTHLAGSRGEPLHLRVAVPSEPVSVAHRALPDEVATCLQKLGEALGALPQGEAHLERLARHYRPGAAWADAFAGMIAELFAAEGLVVLDPRDPALAALAAPVHRRALMEARPIAQALGERVQALAAAGIPAGVHVREAAPLSFFHSDGPAGPRHRLEARGDGFAEVGGSRTHTQAELLEALATRPACFSTSALLRPILQDSWLPTAAYVGGPGEIGYFAQLAPLYDAFELTMPLIVPRIRIRLVDDKSRRLLARRGLDAGDVCRTFDEALARARVDSVDEPGGEALSRQLLGAFERSLTEATPVLSRAGDNMAKALVRTRVTVARAVGKLARKYDAGRARHDQGLLDDVRELQWRLFPDGQPQERYYGCAYFAARYGERPFIERVLATAAPFESAPQDLEL